MQFYTDPDRANDAHSLPDGEVFHADRGDWWIDENGERVDPSDYSALDIFDGKIEPCSEGYYWCSCFPGCLPDSDPFGPFDSEQDAIDDARSTLND